MQNLFNIEQFNIIEDEENYYFFRALNNEDNQDKEKQEIVDKEGNIIRIKTDRERYEENHKNQKGKYSQETAISLEQAYDHIKMHYRRDTNCISLSSNANVSLTYGRGNYQDQYIIVKVPKKEYGEKVINAGQYLLEEIEKRINEYIEQTNLNSNLAEALSKIEQSKTSEEIKKIMEKKYSSEKLDPNKAKLRKNIKYKGPTTRISNCQALTEEQSLEKDKIIAKLTLLEKAGGMQPIIPNTQNNNPLIQTVENAFSSLELIHYGSIEQEEIINIPKEIVDIFAILQQIEGQDEQTIADLKREIIQFAKENKKIFYLTKSQANAKELTPILEKITNNNPKYRKIIEHIAKNEFRIEPNIITRKSNKNA